MKELLAAFAADVLRPIVTLLIPGFWGTIFIFVSVFLKYPIVWAFANDHKNGFSLAYVVVATAAGLIFEDLGGRIENYDFRRLSEDDKAIWYEYVRYAPEREPKGLAYIRTLVLRMKFESGMATAGLFGIVGFAPMSITICQKLVAVLLLTGISCYFVFESRSSFREIVSTRAAIFRRDEAGLPPSN